MYKRRGQVTIFVILGILILLLAALFAYYLTDSNSANSVAGASKDSSAPIMTISKQNPISSIPGLSSYQNIAFEEGALDEYLNLCLTILMKSNLDYMASQGGMFVPRPNSVTTAYGVIAAYPPDVDITHIRKDVESQISLAAKSAMEQCLNLQDSSDLSVLDINMGEIVTEISPGSITLTLNKPLILNSGSSNVVIRDISVTVPSNYDSFIEVEEDIITHGAINPEWLDVVYLEGLDLPVSIMPYSDETVIYSIEDPSSASGVRYLFAIKSDSNSAPELDFAPDFRLKKGQELHYSLMADDSDGDMLSYYCISDGCIVDAQTGELTYITSSIGTQILKIGVRDANDNSFEQEVKVYVEN